MDKKIVMMFINIIIIFFIIVSGCSSNNNTGNPTDSNPTPTGSPTGSIINDRYNLSSRDFKVGVAPIPAHFPGSAEADWLAMDSMIPEVAEIVTAQDGSWRNIAEKGFDSSLIGFAGGLQERRGITPMFGISYCDATEVHDTGKLQIDWSSSKDREDYKDLALNICRTYHPEYLALAIENNFHYRYSPEDFDLWVEAYKDVYDEIKMECPDTKVFVTFQYEMTRGLGTKYWGQRSPEWEIIDRFGDRLDVIAFTTYPELEFGSVESMPDDYYAEILKHTDKPVAFTEVGWQDDDGRFMAKFLELTAGLDKEFVLWTFLHDTKMTTNNPLPKVGLRNYDGSPKEAWNAWKKLKEVPYKGKVN